MKINKKLKKFVLTFLFICFSFFLFRAFVVRQLISRADAFFSFCMFEDATRQYRKAILLDPKNNYARNWLAYTYDKIGDTEAAISTYKKAIEVDSQNRIALYDLGAIYLRQNKYKTAKEYFLKASLVPLENNNKEDIFYHRSSLVMLSNCQEKLQEIEEAIKTNQKILRYYPEDKLARKRIKKLRKLNH